MEIKECIVCKNKLIKVIESETRTWMKCDGCNLIQLDKWDTVSDTATDSEELLAVVQSAQKVITMRPGDRVLDIGCGNGTLLGWYDKRVVTVGIDPYAELTASGLEKKKIDIGIADHFSADALQSIPVSLGIGNKIRFKVITAVAMFNDVPNPIKFLADCKSLLDKEGVIVIQTNYLASVLKEPKLFMDYEHNALYSIRSLAGAVDMAGLDLQGVEISKSNGGSIRAYVTHVGFEKFASDSRDKLWLWTNVQMKLVDEMRMRLSDIDTYATLGQRNEAHVRN